MIVIAFPCRKNLNFSKNLFIVKALRLTPKTIHSWSQARCWNGISVFCFRLRSKDNKNFTNRNEPFCEECSSQRKNTETPRQCVAVIWLTHFALLFSNWLFEFFLRYFLLTFTYLQRSQWVAKLVHRYRICKRVKNDKQLQPDFHFKNSVYGC